MSLPEDLNITGLEPQDQENLLSNLYTLLSNPLATMGGAPE